MSALSIVPKTDEAQGIVAKFGNLYVYLPLAKYKLDGHTTFQGLKIAIENDKGSTRSGVDKDGKPWQVTMTYPYGYIEGTKGTDGDAIDVFIGPNSDAKNAYVIHTRHADEPYGKYDEDKCMLGWDSAEAAQHAFLENYTDAKFFMHIEEIPMQEFKQQVLSAKQFPSTISLNQKLHKRAKPTLHRDFKHPKVQEAQNGMQKVLESLFDRQKNKIVAVTKTVLRQRKLKQKLMPTTELYKASDDNDTYYRDDLINRIEDLLPDTWNSLPSDVQDFLLAAIQAGTDKGIGELSISNTDLINDVNSIAADWARNRAAEMVGMKYDEDGNIIQNPNAKWQISETTRDGIRKLVTEAFESPTAIDTLADQIEESYLFSPERAEMVARTEVKNSAISGNWNVWENSGVVAEVAWINSADPDVCLICRTFMLESPYPFATAPKPVDDSHPSCRCSVVVTKFRDE